MLEFFCPEMQPIFWFKNQLLFSGEELGKMNPDSDKAFLMRQNHKIAIKMRMMMKATKSAIQTKWTMLTDSFFFQARS